MATCACVRGLPSNFPALTEWQFVHEQFHWGNPPPAAEPKIFIFITGVYNFRQVIPGSRRDKACNFLSIGCAECETSCNLFRDSAVGRRFALAFIAKAFHTIQTARATRGLPSPALPIFERDLASTRSCGTTDWIDIPDGFRRKTLNSHLARHFGPGFAAPYDAELCFRSFIHDIHNIAWVQASIHALQCSATAANGAQAGRLNEWAGTRIHAPDLYRKIHKDTRLAAAIHSKLLEIGRFKGIVGGQGRSTKVTRVTSAGVSKVW
jgi:hypothetical protein